MVYIGNPQTANAVSVIGRYPDGVAFLVEGDGSGVVDLDDGVVGGGIYVG
jgi:hypothetical protein